MKSGLVFRLLLHTEATHTQYSTQITGTTNPYSWTLTDPRGKEFRPVASSKILANWTYHILICPVWRKKVSETCSFRGAIANIGLLSLTLTAILTLTLILTPANFGPKCCFFVSYSPSPTCIPNFKFLASMVAEINRDPKFFGCSPSLDPRQFWS